MKKEGILLAVVILLIAAAFVQAKQAEWYGEDRLGVTLDFTYASRYIWRGFDLYRSNDGAIQPSIDVDLCGTGFGFKIWLRRSFPLRTPLSPWRLYARRRLMPSACCRPTLFRRV